MFYRLFFQRKNVVDVVDCADCRVCNRHAPVLIRAFIVRKADKVLGRDFDGRANVVVGRVVLVVNRASVFVEDDALGLVAVGGQAVRDSVALDNLDFRVVRLVVSFVHKNVAVHKGGADYYRLQIQKVFVGREFGKLAKFAPVFRRRRVELGTRGIGDDVQAAADYIACHTLDERTKKSLVFVKIARLGNELAASEGREVARRGLDGRKDYAARGSVEGGFVACRGARKYRRKCSAEKSREFHFTRPLQSAFIRRKPPRER